MPEELKPISKSPIKWILLGTFGVLFSAYMAFLFSGIFIEGYRATIMFNGFTNALIAKQYDRAYNYTSQEFRAVSDYPSFIKVNQQMTQRLGDLKKVTFNHAEYKEQNDGWIGTVDADLIFTHGRSNFIFTLKKANADWEIYNFREQ